MNSITHIDATTVAGAVSALGTNAAVLAGGTDLLPFLRGFVSATPPGALVNIKTIPGLDYIKVDSGTLKIGALTHLTDIYLSSAVQTGYLALSQSAHAVGTPQLRNMGTIGGNLCQKARCQYYRMERNSFNCLRKGGPLCYLITGDNHLYSSIFGSAGGCVTTSESDVAPALMALNAKIVTSKKTVDIENFFAVSGEKNTILDADEIITEVQVPAPAAGTKSVYVKFALRKAFDFPIVGCAAALTVSGGNVTSAGIVLSGVSPTPRRATAAQDYMKGKPITVANAEAAGAEAVKGAVPLTYNSYKVQIAKTMVKRAILAAQ